MDSNPVPQSDTSSNTTAEEPNVHPGPNVDFGEILLSDKFREQFNKRMDEIPKGDDTRAEVHFRLGGQYNLYYDRNGSLAFLEHAIRHTEEALEELPKPHERLETYVAVYSHLLQQKVMNTQTNEDSDRYISGLRLGISFLEECSLKEEKKRELGCAYLSKYTQTKDIEGLKLAIETLEECFETPEKRYPQATIYLGAALTYRYQQDKRLDDMVKSIDLLRKGLEAIPRKDEHYAPLRDFGMDSLVSASAIASSAPCGASMRSQLLNSLDQALLSAPGESDQTDRIKKYRQALDDSGKDPLRNAQLLRSLGQQSFADWKSCRNVSSLDDAIRLVGEAVDELPPGCDVITEYADMLVFYAQTKAVAIQGPESTEEYIKAIQAAVDCTSQEGAVNNPFVQRLAWAYWARFEISKGKEDLDNVISYINGLIDIHHDILPATELVLGTAFHSRYLSTKSAEDIEKALGLLEKALKSPDAGQPVRHLYLEKLVMYSVDMLGHTSEKPDLNRLISNAKFAISELPQSASKDEIEGLLSKAETSRELLGQRPLLDSIFKEFGDLKLNDQDGPKTIGKTYVPKALYDQFAIGPGEIRTLEVISGEPDEDIHCKLHNVALASEIEYEACHFSESSRSSVLTNLQALSYTWGDPDKVSDIMIENHRCKVTVNVVLALRRLRQRNTSRILWIDAVCINQRDSQEKAHQVAMMGEIYERASQVLTWLGEPSTKDSSSSTMDDPRLHAPNYELPLIEWTHGEKDISLMRTFFLDENVFEDWPVVGALSTLELLARNCHLNTLPFFQDPRYSSFDIGIYPSDLWRQSVGALVELLSSPYWSRVWIVQEMVLGTCVRVHYGRHIIPFEVFLDAERLMRNHYYGCCYYHCAAKSNNQWSSFFEVLRRLGPIRNFGNMKTTRASLERTNIYHILLAGIDFREATDPKDYIYGLLGLLPDHQDDDLLRPDYTLSVAQVYTRAALKIMRDSGDLRLLSYADRQSPSDDLPSWCHDFGGRSPFNPQPYDWELFSTCCATDFKANLNADLSLEVRGCHLDTITHVTEARTPESLSRSSFHRWIEDGLKLARKQCAMVDTEYIQDSPTHIEEVYGRTLIGDTFTNADGYNHRASSKHLKLLYAWLDWMKENVPPETRDWPARQPPIIFSEVAKTFLDRTQSRKLFTTKDKRLGMGISTVFGQEKEVLPGDQIWLLQGSNLPVVLRQIPAHAQEPGDAALPTKHNSNYVLVGTAYVHGIMDGEVPTTADMFADVTLGHYPGSSKSPKPANEVMRDALRVSLLLGHGSRSTTRNRSNYAPSSRVETDEAQTEEEDQDVNAEVLLFPEGRNWPDSMKPIPEHRVLLAALLQNPPATEAEWEELEKNMEERATKDKEDPASSSLESPEAS